MEWPEAFLIVLMSSIKACICFTILGSRTLSAKMSIEENLLFEGNASLSQEVSLTKSLSLGCHSLSPSFSSWMTRKPVLAAPVRTTAPRMKNTGYRVTRAPYLQAKFTFYVFIKILSGLKAFTLFENCFTLEKFAGIFSSYAGQQLHRSGPSDLDPFCKNKVCREQLPFILGFSTTGK